MPYFPMQDQQAPDLQPSAKPTDNNLLMAAAQMQQMGKFGQPKGQKPGAGIRPMHVPKPRRGKASANRA